MKVLDMHCDTLLELDLSKNLSLRDSQLNVSLKKMKQGDYLLQNFAIFTNLRDCDNPVNHVNTLIDRFYQEIEANTDMIDFVFNYEDIERNKKQNKMSALLTLEEGAVVNNNLSYLRNYYRLGVRMITLTWNFENGIGFPNFDYEDSAHGFNTSNAVDGLTPFGIKYIHEMELLGIIIDVSHLSDAGFYDVLKYTTKPFVASHSNARSICPHARNLSDDMIRALAKRGGVMGINFAGDFLTQPVDEKESKSTIQAMVQHIQHIVLVGGIDCIGLGSDFDGIPQNLELEDASQMPKLEQALYDVGFTKSDVEKIFYKNVLRVYKDVLK